MQTFINPKLKSAIVATLPKSERRVPLLPAGLLRHSSSIPPPPHPRATQPENSHLWPKKPSTPSKRSKHSHANPTHKRRPRLKPIGSETQRKRPPYHQRTLLPAPEYCEWREHQHTGWRGKRLWAVRARFDRVCRGYGYRKQQGQKIGIELAGAGRGTPGECGCAGAGDSV